MSRYKGRQNTKAVERDFPHFVDIVVPPGGLGKRLNTRCTNFMLATAFHRSAVKADMMPMAKSSGGVSLIH